jgi:glycosyltransferase involved in cell wall biosynthesis
MLGNRHALRAITQWSNRIYRSADQLVALSPGFKRNLVERGVPENRIEVIYNWCDEARIGTNERDADLAQHLGMADRCNVVFAGTMGVMQSLDCVIDAAQIVATTLPKVQFVFVGGGTEVPRLAQKAEAMGLHNVRFIPRMPMDQIGKVLALADALLVHLKDEPLFRITIPSKTQAYMAAGKPILMGVLGDAAILVRDAQCGLLCNPESASSIAGAVKELEMMSQWQRNEMGERGRSFYHRKLSMETGVNQFERLFKRVTFDSSKMPLGFSGNHTGSHI